MSVGAKAMAEMRCLAAVQMEPISWLWEKRFARGKLNLIAGQPGLGKSQITTFMAAKVSRGGKWPDGAECPCGRVVFICCEDDAADTIAPRLDAAGADRTKVHILDWIIERSEHGPRRRSFEIGKDAEIVRDICKQLGDVSLIVVDPVSAYLGAADSHKMADICAALAPMQATAAEIDACVVLVSHLNKGSADSSAMSRVSGSGAFVAAARSAWVVGLHPQDEASRVLVPLKNNIGDDKTGFAYRIMAARVADNIETSHVAFDRAAVRIKPEDVLAGASRQLSPGGGPAGREAERFLREELAHGPRAANDLRVRATAAGVSWRTVERAKNRLGVRAEKDHRGGGEWRWHMPAEATQDRQHRHPLCDGIGGSLADHDKDRHGLPSETVGGVGGLGRASPHVNGSAGELF